MLLLLACVYSPEPISQTGGEDIPTIAAAPADAITSPPFTAEELRRAFPVGTTVRLRIRMSGEADREHRWQVTAADESGMTLATWMYAADGTLLKDEGENTSTWAELLTHAQFAAARTAREDSTVEVPAGTFDTWLYTVVEPEKDRVSRYHFAKTLPGPPVRYTIQEGKGTVMEMELIERR